MAESLKLTCNMCGGVGFDDGSDGFYYCRRCGSQAEDIMDTGVAEEDFASKTGELHGGGIYLNSHRRKRPLTVIKAEPLSQSQQIPYQSQLWNTLTQDTNDCLNENINAKKENVDTVGPTGPSDFGSNLGGSQDSKFYAYYSKEVRRRYVTGIQFMIQFQCEALVEKFGASPLICGLAGPLWLRLVAVSRVFDDAWADEVFHESEMQKPGLPEDFKPRAKYRAEPHNLHGERATMIWYRSLRKRIPLSCSLVVSFLACHIAREAILPTDIVKWSLEGKLPYFAAFVDIEKKFQHLSSTFPLSSNLMFRPSHAVPLQKLESMAASIAESIGLDLPPVNFYAIASRYLTQLSLPRTKILPHACCIYDWSMPPDLWLSSNELRLPTRVCVMSILIVSIRILYNLNGFGKWEMSLSRFKDCSFSNHAGKLEPACSSEHGDGIKQVSDSLSFNLGDSDTLPGKTPSYFQDSDLDAAELLHSLDTKYFKICETYEYSKDLPQFLNFCKNVAFAGLEPSCGYYEEEKIIELLWDYYLNKKDVESTPDHEVGCGGFFNQKRSRDGDGCSDSLSKENKKIRDRKSNSSASTEREILHSDYHPGHDGAFSFASMPESQNLEPYCQESADTLKDEAIRRLKSDMEENRFCYIPPRKKLKRFDYLHYERKKDEGALTYVAHADYYILLRACARVAQVDIRIMHIGVLSFERRLAWLEKRIDHCLHLTRLNASCELSRDMVP